MPNSGAQFAGPGTVRGRRRHNGVRGAAREFPDFVPDGFGTADTLIIGQDRLTIARQGHRGQVPSATVMMLRSAASRCSTASTTLSQSDGLSSSRDSAISSEYAHLEPSQGRRHACTAAKLAHLREGASVWGRTASRRIITPQTGGVQSELCGATERCRQPWN